MADEADRAQNEIDYLIKTGLSKTKNKMAFTGYCYECGDDLIMVEGDIPALFCCPDCRDMYEKREKMRRINGQ